MLVVVLLVEPVSKTAAAKTGIDVDPAGGIGNVEISLDATLEDLGNVIGTPVDGNLLIFDGSNWTVGTLNTAGLALANPSTFTTRLNAISPYATQEDANNILADLIEGAQSEGRRS